MLVGVVTVNHTGSRHSPQVNKWVVLVCLSSICGLLTSVVDGPSWKWGYEISRIWVINHYHCAKSVIEITRQNLDVNSRGWCIAKIKYLLDLCVVARVILNFE